MSIFHQRVSEFQRKMIRGALRRNHGNQVHAARELGLHRNTLARHCELLGIDVSAFRPSKERVHAMNRARRKKAMEKGLCANCQKNPAGGNGGTVTCCPPCAERKRDNAQKRSKRLGLYRVSSKQPLPPPEPHERLSQQYAGHQRKAVELMLELSARLSARERQGAAQRSA